MAKKQAPAKLTGGAGFNYEDYIAGRLLVDMLRGTYSFGPTFGRVTKVDWQARDTKRLLDDLLVTLDGSHTAELSIKSDRQVTESGFPENFVEAAWEEWLAVNSTAFKHDADLLVLVTGKIAGEVLTAWEKTLRESLQTTTERIVARLTPPADTTSGSLSSKLQRDQFKSLHCPDALKDRGQSDAGATVELLKRIRLLTFDFESDPSRSEASALLDCQSALVSGDSTEAAKLWRALLRIAADKRATGGSIDLPDLVSTLRGSFTLNAFPDYRTDLDAIDRISSDFLEGIRLEIGGTHSLARADCVAEVADLLKENGLCLIAGESGCGKSGIAKLVAQQRFNRIVAVPRYALESGDREQFHHALNLSHALQDIVRGSPEDCLLLFDSIERYSTEATRLAARLISDIIADEKCMHVSVLLVSQFESAQRVISDLIGGGVEHGRLRVHQIECPEESAIASLLGNFPGIPFIELRREMRPLLRNLKILDWVVRASLAGANVSQANVTGLTSLIDYLWDRWVQAGDMTIARSGLLKHIAELEAETLSSGVRLSQLNHSEHASIPAMVTSDLLRTTRDEKVRFTHDLLGDWARLKCLIEQDPTTTTDGLTRAALPRWHRAVRLFGKWLLDSPDGVRRWTEALTRAGDQSSNGTVVRDLILEAVVLDSTSASKFNEVWPTLITNEASLLRRLLDRFLFVATIPDPRLQDNNLDARVAAHIEVAFRLPFYPYWPALLEGLHQHIADVVRIAPVETAKISRMWLEKTPHQIAEGVPFPWRGQAAQLALAVAREVQALTAEGAYFADDEDRIAYEAALFAATDLPDEVSALALELSNRRPPAAQIAARSEAARQAAHKAMVRRKNEDPGRFREMQSLILPSFSSRQDVAPWPDGPNERVSDSFREAVFESSAWLSLLRAQPAVGAEVLLAVCIEEPQYNDLFGGSGLSDCYGLDDWHKGYPSLYFRGPFLQFFRQVPSIAIDFALRVVNFATQRWAQSQRHLSRRHDQPSPSEDELSVSFPIAGEERRWLGGHQVYRWHSDGLCHTRILPSLLMALEKYLYEQLDAEKPISAEIQAILERGHSLAFAGLLIDVGKYRPDLFLTDLRPLLGAWELYFLDRELVQDRVNFHGGLIGWDLQPEQLRRLAFEWHRLEHRKYVLIELAQLLLTQSEETASFFRECIDQWQLALGDGEVPDFFPTLVAVLNRDNYQSVITDDGQAALRFEMPGELQQRRRESAQAAQEEIQLLTFPMTCRQWLDGKKILEESQLDELWEMLQSIARQEVDDPQAPSRKEDAVMGGVAVLLCKYRDWLRQSPEKEKWCLEQLRTVTENPPPGHSFDSAQSASEWHWDYFVAEAGIALLSEDLREPFARRLVATGITAFHYGVTTLTMRRAFENADVPGDVLASLQSLAIRWSLIYRIRTRSEQLLSYTRHWQDTPLEQFDELPSADQVQAIAEHWRYEHISAVEQFVDGVASPIGLAEARSQGLLILEELENLRPQIGGRPEPRAANAPPRRRKFDRADFGIDVSVVQSAFSWLESADARLRLASADLLLLVGNLQTLVLGTIPVPSDHTSDELDDSPNDFDLWVFAILSRTIAQTGNDDEARSFWEPILELGPYAHDFIERFFWHWFVEGLQAVEPQVFVERWTSMIRYALASDRWMSESPEFYRQDKMAFELLGYHFGELMADDARFAALLEKEAAILSQAAERWFRLPHVVNGFARHVTKPAYERLLCNGIEWIHRAVAESDPDDFRHERDFESNLIHVLRCGWERHQGRIAAEPNLRAAFQALLNDLAANGSHAAMNLRDRLLESLSA